MPRPHIEEVWYIIQPDKTVTVRFDRNPPIVPAVEGEVRLRHIFQRRSVLQLVHALDRQPGSYRPLQHGWYWKRWESLRA